MTVPKNWETPAAVISALNSVGSASTRTHVHKLLYFAETWGILPAEYRFALYLHGPYSYELDKTLLQMEAFGQVRKNANPSGYGAHYAADGGSPPSELLRLAEWLGKKGTRSLEALSTSLFVGPLAREQAVARVLELKPHLSIAEVEAAVDEVAAKAPEFVG